MNQIPTKPMNKPKKKKVHKQFAKFFLFIFKLISAGGIGLFLSAVGQAMINYHYFSFMFVFLTVLFAFFTLVKKFSFLGVLMVDLLFIFLITLARLYIIIASNG